MLRFLWGLVAWRAIVKKRCCPKRGMFVGLVLCDYCGGLWCVSLVGARVFLWGLVVCNSYRGLWHDYLGGLLRVWCVIHVGACDV